MDLWPLDPTFNNVRISLWLQAKSIGHNYNVHSLGIYGIVFRRDMLLVRSCSGSLSVCGSCLG